MSKKRGNAKSETATVPVLDEPKPVIEPAIEPAVIERQPSHREDPFLGFSEAAAILGVSRGTIYNWVVRKRILKSIWRGPLRVIRRSEIDRFLSVNSVQTVQ